MGAGVRVRAGAGGISAADAGGLQLDEWGAGGGGGWIFADEQLSFSNRQNGSLQCWFGIDECEEWLEFGGV